ncbi:lysophospholipase L1-like esterase [Spirosoma oryzae]|uniref:Lysophospholipase L1-like esterase n=1 Tax=Spirosoma oryzae TaxID=1469603 RepID=A0A2T0T0K2_9BACT|nr:SGNH/GDSL hydrolase family protein [Spirosoma oryzae]PRY39184.1 lysophospholipase L1-like esterase [Spirosoma oryzae]
MTLRLTRQLFCLLLLIGAFSFRAPQQMTWVAIGDSITYLNDHPEQTGNRITKGYMTRVVEKLPYIKFVNQGHNGWTAIRIAQQIDSLGLTKADIYSVFLGTNDWWHSKPLGHFTDYQQNTGTGTVYGSFRIILDKLRRLNPQARLLLITPMPRTDFVQINNPKNNAYGSYKPKTGQTLESFAQAIDSIGRAEQIPVVDLYHLRSLRVERLVKFKRLKNPATGQYVDYRYPDYTTIPFNPATDEYPYPPAAIDRTYDGLHPSDEGYELITRQLVRRLKAFR